MFKYAVLFFLISLVAGAVGLTNISTFAKRISIALFLLFFLSFLALLGFAYLLGEAFEAGSHSTPAPAAVLAFADGRLAGVRACRPAP